ncbi:MAG: hypothetical protein WCS31_07795 [Verrucomicrobiae bacterium]
MTKLQQDQVWITDNGFVRIVRLERLSVTYKLLRELASRDGTHHQATKKEFCRIIKSATLLTAAAQAGEPR